MDIYVFFLLLAVIIFVTCGVTIYFEAKVTAGSRITEGQFKELSEKLDIALTRIETLERLATDENEHLKRRFDEISKQPNYA
ncbi:hypothetical protein [Hirschia litorea]|uniref:Phage shock protein B n=1 Tax=Hirschia litorea TaxID=1199156 RepID=A0ABW2INS5_9PROT